MRLMLFGLRWIAWIGVAYLVFWWLPGFILANLPHYKRAFDELGHQLPAILASAIAIGEWLYEFGLTALLVALAILMAVDIFVSLRLQYTRKCYRIGWCLTMTILPYSLLLLGPIAIVVTKFALADAVIEASKQQLNGVQKRAP